MKVFLIILVQLTSLIYFHQLHLLHFNRSAPAPLSLCSIPGFDLKNKDMMCPPERNALKEFYESTKGQEWTNDENWIDEYGNHCTMPWLGIKCKDDSVVGLNLTNNGLSGRLTTHISSLPSLEVLDLSDNDIKVSFVSICICRAS